MSSVLTWQDLITLITDILVPILIYIDLTLNRLRKFWDFFQVHPYVVFSLSYLESMQAHYSSIKWDHFYNSGKL